MASEPKLLPGKEDNVLVPAPPPRPADLKLNFEQPELPAVQTQIDGISQSVCVQAFAERGGTILPSPPIESVGQCAINDPITFQRIRLSDRVHAEFESPVTVRCSLALEVQAWARDDLTAIILQASNKLVRIVGVSGQACRPRNGVVGAPISEHASGNALDLSGFTFDDGRKIMFAATDSISRAQRQAIQKTACARFTTVLGPGSDTAHQDHLHIDMRQRKHGYRICQWPIESE